MSVNRSRSIKKEFYIDEVENNILRMNMSKFGMKKFSTYARRMLLYPQLPIITVDTSDYDRVTKELRRIGNNLNQVAKLANQNKQVDAQMIIQLESFVQELANEMSKDIALKIEEVKANYGGH